MDAKRLFLPILAVAAVAAGALGSLHARSASAEVPYPELSPYLRAAIEADVEAAGHQYGGDCRFDAMYLAHGDWCSMVQSVSATGVVVTVGPYATDDITTVTFVRDGVYGFRNPATGFGSPERVPALAAQPGTATDSWVVEGINFNADEELALFDGSGCGGEQRCPGDHVLGTVRAGADGYFKTTVQFDPETTPIPGQTRRLLQVSGGAFIQVAFHHDGATPGPTPIDPATPGTPATPTQPSDPPAPPATGSDDSNGDDKLLWGALAGVAGLLFGVLGLVTVGRRR